MLHADDIMTWLIDLPAGAKVAIDDGGLALVLVGDEDVYLEVGGTAEGDEARDSGMDRDLP